PPFPTARTARMPSSSHARPFVAVPILALVATICPAQAPEVPRSTPAPSRVEIRVDETTFSVPAGVTVERAAPESLSTWPIVADWDAAGRLVVVESGGV